MREILAYCGLVCQTCPIYLATKTKNGDKQAIMRNDIARLLNKQYGLKYDPGEITDCDGCTKEGGRLFSSCQNCLVRKCAREKEFENCAYCSEYACKRLEVIFTLDPSARERLDEIRAVIKVYIESGR